MSVESFAIALNHSRATGTARLVLLGIANHDGDGGAWPSVATLARYAGGVDRRNVHRAIEKLEALGEARRLISAGGDQSTADHRRPNLYQFLLTCPHDCDRTKNHRTARSVRVVLDGVALAPPVAETPPGGGSATGRRGAGATRTIPRTEVNQVDNATTDAGANQRCRGHRSGRHDWRSGYCGFCGEPQPIAPRREQVNA